MNNDNIVIGLADVSLFLANIGKKEYSKTVEEACFRLSNQNWIPVSKKLPEKTGFYIVSINQRVIDNHGEHLELKSTEMWFDGEQKVFTEHCAVFNPTHWMPLPKPPKEGDVDG